MTYAQAHNITVRFQELCYCDFISQYNWNEGHKSQYNEFIGNELVEDSFCIAIWRVKSWKK